MFNSFYSTRKSIFAGTNATIVKEALTSADALKAAKLDFEVLQEPVFDGEQKAIPGYKINRKSDDGKILGMVSDRYKVVQNTDAFAFTDGLIGPGCTYENAGSCNNWRTIWLQASLEPKMVMGDWYYHYLIFKNSFDGKAAVKVCVTPIRVICQNTLNLAVKKAYRSFSISHIGDIEGKIKEADRTLKLSEEYFTEVHEDYVRLARIKISNEKIQKFWEELFPMDEDSSEREKRNAFIQREQIQQCYNADDLANFRGTAFGVVNAVSDMISHSEPLRMTSSYFGNLFDKVTNGHPMLDKVYALVNAKA